MDVTPPAIRTRQLPCESSGSPTGVSNIATATDQEPVFLHSLWRAGSTYLFGKFRETRRFYCLYEPLHEFMGRLDEEHLREYSSQNLAAQLNHRSMVGGYFDEYRSLQGSRACGIPGYRESMAVAGFFEGENSRFQRYISSLVAGCQAQGRRPLLQFCRSSGRLEVFGRCLAGSNVYLQRNPRDQWQSYLAAESPYYMPLTVAIATLKQPDAQRLSTILQRPLPRAGTLFGVFRRWPVRRTLRAAQKVERELSDADRYRIFYAEWLRAGREAQLHCNLLVDINRISREASMREEAEDAFSIRLDDCRVKEYKEHRLPAYSMTEIERQVTALFE